MLHYTDKYSKINEGDNITRTGERERGGSVGEDVVVAVSYSTIFRTAFVLSLPSSVPGGLRDSS